MATINSVTFSAGSGGQDGVYDTGDTITITANYVADTPSVVVTPTPFTATTTITDGGGNVTASNASPFTVNVQSTNPAGDVASESDSGSRAWTTGATAPQADGSLTVTFTATA